MLLKKFLQVYNIYVLIHTCNSVFGVVIFRQRLSHRKKGWPPWTDRAQRGSISETDVRLGK